MFAIITDTFQDVRAAAGSWYAKKALKTTLCDIKIAAAEYEKAKLPAGHEYYKNLLTQAHTAIDLFCTQHGESKDAIVMQAPFLFTLEKKANPEIVQQSGLGLGKVIGIFLLTTLAIAVAALLIGMGNGIFHKVASWFVG